VPSQPTEAGRVRRLAGPTRVETAAAISAATFEPGGPVAFVATAADFPDALTAGAAAGALGGPVLLVHPDAVPRATAVELRRLDARRIVVVGGTRAVSPAVETELRRYTSAGLRGSGEPQDGGVVRYSGPTRFETAAEIAAGFATSGGTVMLTSGEQFPDAMSGGPAAGSIRAPILLTERDALPQATAEKLEELRPTVIWIVGGSAAVSEAVLEEVALRTGAEIRRLWGPDRYGTAVAVAREHFPGSGGVLYVASGEAFPDALAAAPAAIAAGAPVLLTGRDVLPETVRTYVRQAEPDRIIILGGPNAISAEVEARLRNPSP
jgi:putative cell wall-binding protein